MPPQRCFYAHLVVEGGGGPGYLFTAPLRRSVERVTLYEGQRQGLRARSFLIGQFLVSDYLLVENPWLTFVVTRNRDVTFWKKKYPGKLAADDEVSLLFSEN